MEQKERGKTGLTGSVQGVEVCDEDGDDVRKGGLRGRQGGSGVSGQVGASLKQRWSS